MKKRIDGTPYVDAVHLEKSIRATGMSKKGLYVHTCPDDVLQLLERYFDKHEWVAMSELKKAYDGPALRLPIGVALLVKQGRIELVGTKRRSPIFARRRGLLQRIFKR
jgi:hypothetical protein